MARRRGYMRALFHPPHNLAGTASNVLAALDRRLNHRARPHAAATAPARRPAPAIGHTRVGFRDGVIGLTPVTSPADPKM